jgi:uncharacterized protein (UPF0335 family)
VQNSIFAHVAIPQARRRLRVSRASLAWKEEIVDHKLNQLLDELRKAIGESVSASEEIADVVAKIREGGYDILVVLNATITVKQQGAGLLRLLARTKGPIDCKFNSQDVKFLKELHIKGE